jgi:negative regulator of sigma E activity
MNTMHTEILSALVDGEPVDLERLSAALDDAEARRALVDFVRLREAARSDSAALPASLSQLRKAPATRQLLRLAAAAAVLLFVFIAGLLTPMPWDDRDSNGVQPPPQPVRVEKFQPGVDWHPGD